MVPWRRARRFPVGWLLHYRRTGADTWLPARTVNMSVSGVLFRATRPPAPAGNLELRIFMQGPEGLRLPETIIEVTGHVVRHEPTLEDAVAVKFQSHVTALGTDHGAPLSMGSSRA
jgi:hypothetical protein